MARTDVSEMVNLCKGLGLRVAFEGGGNHYTVRDPNTEAKLFYISSTPSDSNFKYEIARHLRRLGLLKGNLKFGKFKTVSRRKHIGAIDLVALKKAQDQAASSGERIPLLEDIDGQTEFFLQMKGKDKGYTHEAQQEAIDHMAMKLTPRGNATKQRLRKILDEKKISNSDFVRLSMEVAEKRDLRGFGSLNAGQSSIGAFRKDDDKTVQIWTMNLIEATLDHIEGLKWDEIDESRKVSGAMDSNTANDLASARQEEFPEPTNNYVTEETLGNILDNFRVQIERVISDTFKGYESQPQPTQLDSLRERYAEKLLAVVDSDVNENILNRLDKLVGLE